MVIWFHEPSQFPFWRCYLVFQKEPSLLNLSNNILYPHVFKNKQKHTKYPTWTVFKLFDIHALVFFRRIMQLYKPIYTIWHFIYKKTKFQNFDNLN